MNGKAAQYEIESPPKMLFLFEHVQVIDREDSSYKLSGAAANCWSAQ